MNRFRHLFNKKCAIIGMIHLDALPGTPRYRGSVQKIIDKALREIDIYLNSYIDGILVENMNDVPYVQSKHLGVEITATMAHICGKIKDKCSETPLGVQVLAGANKEALAIASACDLSFIRAEGFVFAHVADEGFTDACAGEILRYRKSIGADEVMVFTDIKKKHSSHSITADVSLIETAFAAEFFLSDGIILTGTATGKAADAQELQDLKSEVSLPVIIGSGVTEKNLENYLDADALIIGSHFKKDGHWKNTVDSLIVKSFMNKIKNLRN